MLRPIREYQVTLNNGTTFTVRACTFCFSGQQVVTFSREQPGTDPTWNAEYGPNIDHVNVAMFSDISSVVLVDHPTRE